MEIPQGLKRPILEEAQHLISSERRNEYGPVSDSFARIAKIASILTGKSLDKFDICKIMISLKLARQMANEKRDNLVDLAGYVGLWQQLIDEDSYSKETKDLSLVLPLSGMQPRSALSAEKVFEQSGVMREQRPTEQK